MEHFDTVIIGSGAGGLATAICLSRAGQKVLVLEQHDVPGGWCHSFQLNGQRFSPGVHYIGGLDAGQSTSKLYEGLGVANDLVFFRMNAEGYEHCWIGAERIDMPAGLEALDRSLARRFPDEKERLHEYLTLVRQVSRELQLLPRVRTFWDKITIPFRTKHMGKFALFSLKRVIDWHIKDPVLKAVLNVQCGDHGLPPFKASFPVHCAVMDHYFDGAYYPMGGGAGIVKALTKAFKTHGGEIRTKQRVKHILIRDRRAIGVELDNGQQILANSVVSNADPRVTYTQLVGKEHISARLNRKLSKTRFSVTSLMLFLTLDLDVTKAGLDSGNIWMLEHERIDDIYLEMMAKNLLDGDEFPAVFISCTTLKDPSSFNGRYHNLEVVTFIDYDSFGQFNGTGDHHGDAYSRQKERICAKLMNSIERIIPGAKEHVVQMELGTPKTNQFYLNATDGCVYGTEKSFFQVGPFSFKIRSEIEGLFLCGASTLAHGVSGATYSGVAAAAQILGCKPEDLLHSDENQRVRIYDAEDRTTWPDWIDQKVAGKKSRFKEIDA